MLWTIHVRSIVSFFLNFQVWISTYVCVVKKWVHGRLRHRGGVQILNSLDLPGDRCDPLWLSGKIQSPTGPHYFLIKCVAVSIIINVNFQMSKIVIIWNMVDVEEADDVYFKVHIMHIAWDLIFKRETKWSMN